MVFVGGVGVVEALLTLVGTLRGAASLGTLGAGPRYVVLTGRDGVRLAALGRRRQQ